VRRTEDEVLVEEAEEEEVEGIFGNKSLLKEQNTN
jgi:hypothetical protein